MSKDDHFLIVGFVCLRTLYVHVHDMYMETDK